MSKEIIATKNAPGAIGAYSQAVKSGNTVYVSGQIPLVPATMEVVEGDVVVQIRQVFENLSAVCFLHNPIQREPRSVLHSCLKMYR